MTVSGVRRRSDFLFAAILLGLALVLGGGSPVAPLQRMIVELFGVVVLGWLFVRAAAVPRDRVVDVALVIVGLLTALVVIQLIPMPPSLWRTLPGRGVAADVLDVVGAREAWLPLSLDPAATLECGLFLIPAVAMFLVALRLDRDAQTKLLLMIVAAATISAVLVMLQAQGATWLTIYDAPHATKGKGIFANKNHNAALLVAAIPLVAMLGQRLSFIRPVQNQRVAAGILVAFLTIAVFGCLSRAGLAMLPIALLACVPLFGAWNQVRRHWKIAVAVAVAMVVAAVTISQSSIVQETLARFNTTQEGRYLFWPDVLSAIRQFMPWGSGLGTFVPIFRINESLAAVHETYTNHAHSDYLEIALEAGVPGLLVLLAFLAWFAVATVVRLRAHVDTRDFSLTLSAVVGIGLLLAASIVDYPLRTVLLANVLAVFAAILANPAPARPRPLNDTGGRAPQRAGLANWANAG